MNWNLIFLAALAAVTVFVLIVSIVRTERELQRQRARERLVRAEQNPVRIEIHRRNQAARRALARESIRVKVRDHRGIR